MKGTTTLTLVLSLLIASNTLAQTISQPGGRTLKLADYAFAEGNLYPAIDLYIELWDEENDLYYAHQIGESYRYLREYNQAAKWYKITVDAEGSQFVEDEFWLGVMQEMTAQYDTAIATIKSFQRHYRGDQMALYIRLIRQHLGHCKFALEHRIIDKEVVLENLGDQVNTAHADLSPVMLEDNTLLISTIPRDTLITLSKKQKSAPFVQMYEVGAKLKLTSRPFNDDQSHTGNGYLSPDSSQFYFTRCSTNSSGKMICNIWISDWSGKDWKEPIKLGTPVNRDDHTSSHPVIGKVKDQKVLFFVSDRPGGKGGKDIWYVPFEDGGFGVPVNPGSRVNTFFDETTPYFHSKNGSLYFSSAGHFGYGGLDIFKTIVKGTRWAKPVNIGRPFNSSADDFYFKYYNEYEGFVVSNRPGGIIMDGETCCDDIYGFNYPRPIVAAVQGYALLLEDKDRTPIDGANILLEQNGEMVARDTTADGKTYFFELDTNRSYQLLARKEGYIQGRGEVRTFGMTRSDTLWVDLYLHKIEKEKTFTLRNVYFEFNSSELKEESNKAMNELLTILNENPDIIMEIGAHTDSKGSSGYNLKLSQKRAESIVTYLIGKGLTAVRLKAKGYGESKPIAPNSKTDGTDDPKGRQLNRRTEFKVIGELEGLEYKRDELKGL